MVEVAVRAGREDDGGTLVETALVLSTFFLLLFGIFSLAVALAVYDNATFASRAGARYASMHSPTSQTPCNAACVQSYADQFLYATAGSVVTVNTSYGTSNAVGNTVTVSITIKYPTLIPFSTLKLLTLGSSAQRTISR
jgi:Flp pilus assembly protein TadG